ncbi:hypothetical protein BT63DRAFT_438446 [Microthyrium microscopicum]|uniref:Uncharacterized protein n=1 Tax=Microthyrium microscopicum TaxID=703497 RepID=A0A6A6UJ03_9PEZI|nr:hypothetical protein BT63DRAFT_438446 [Microthyrium microscopicum]
MGFSPTSFQEQRQLAICLQRMPLEVTCQIVRFLLPVCHHRTIPEFYEEQIQMAFRMLVSLPTLMEASRLEIGSLFLALSSHEKQNVKVMPWIATVSKSLAFINGPPIFHIQPSLRFPRFSSDKLSNWVYDAETYLDSYFEENGKIQSPKEAELLLELCHEVCHPAILIVELISDSPDLGNLLSVILPSHQMAKADRHAIAFSRITRALVELQAYIVMRSTLVQFSTDQIDALHGKYMAEYAGHHYKHADLGTLGAKQRVLALMEFLTSIRSTISRTQSQMHLIELILSTNLVRRITLCGLDECCHPFDSWLGYCLAMYTRRCRDKPNRRSDGQGQLSGWTVHVCHSPESRNPKHLCIHMHRFLPLDKISRRFKSSGRLLNTPRIWSQREQKPKFCQEPGQIRFGDSYLKGWKCDYPGLNPRVCRRMYRYIPKWPARRPYAVLHACPTMRQEDPCRSHRIFRVRPPPRHCSSALDAMFDAEEKQARLRQLRLDWTWGLQSKHRFARSMPDGAMIDPAEVNVPVVWVGHDLFVWPDELEEYEYPTLYERPTSRTSRHYPVPADDLCEHKDPTAREFGTLRFRYCDQKHESMAREQERNF